MTVEERPERERGTDVLHRRTTGLSYDEITAFLARRVGDHVIETVHEYDTYSVLLDHEGYLDAAEFCRDHDLLDFDLFDCLFGVDRREEGFEVVAVLYSTASGRRILLRTMATGGREAPTAPTLTHLWHGADWHERETWDMFGIEFDGHPQLAPRILCPENFEGWPLRKDFYLATRAAKPWPGVKEPAELDDDGNVIERVPGPGDAPGPMALDEAMAKQSKLANPVMVSTTPDAEPPPEETATGPSDEPKPASDTMPASKDEGAAKPTELSEQADERVVEGEVERAVEDVTDHEKDAAARAEDKRKAAAEARARKAAERAEEGPVTTPPDETADVPEDSDRDPGTTAAGGPPAPGDHGESGQHQPQSTVDTEMGETVDQAREKGTADLAAGEPEVTPEGREADVDRDHDEPTDPDDGGER